MVNQDYQKYHNNSIMTARPEDLTLMLYSGAIKFCNQAIEAINKKEIEKSHISILKAQNIIEELQIKLDKSYEVAEGIDKLYEFMKQLLVEANVEKNIDKLEDVIYFLREFKEMWQNVIKQTRVKHTS